MSDEPEASAPEGARPRILIVDDERESRRLVCTMLAPDDYEILVSSSGEEALNLVGACEIHAVILDAMLPGMDGFELCRQLRKRWPRQLLPVIFVSALADAASTLEAECSGADHFLTKPVSFDLLRSRVRHLIAGRAEFTQAAQQRQLAEEDSRRFRRVSEIAGALANCRDYGHLLDSLRATLEPDLPLHGIAYFEAASVGCRLIATSRSVPAVPRAPSTKHRTLTLESLDKVFLSVRPVLVPSERSERLPVDDMLDASGMPAAAAFIPVLVGDRVRGVLLLSRESPVSARESVLLEDLAPHVANAFAHVRAQLTSKDLDEARDRMTTLLVHDLKNPLSVVKGNLDYLSTPGLSEADRAEALGDARRAADQLLEMIVDVLDIGRAEEGNLTVNFRALRVGTVVEEIVSHLALSATTKGISLRCVSAANPRALFDEKLLRRVMQNLLQNAFRYVATRGKIEVGVGVEVEVEGNWAVIRISNDGPPIDPRVRAHLFDKYGVTHAGQGHSNRGLGLYLCRLVVDAHGGSIAVVDRVEWGATFEIRIPALVG